MSLQVWMPLLGNLNNQGLYNPTITTMGTQTFSTPGKIGASCYKGASSFNGTATNTFKIPWDFDNDEISIAFWLKPTVTSDTTWLNPFALGQFSNRLEVTNTSGSYCWYNSDDSGITKVPLIEHGTNMSSISNDVWTHITVVISETEFKLYKNGSLSITKTLSNKLSAIWGTQKYIWIMSSLSHQNIPFNGCMNDLRIYDHALSTKEVKEVAKGLVCHYKLSPVGGENLLVNIPNWNPVSGQFGTFTKTYDTQERIFTINCTTAGAGIYSFPSCTLTANTTYTWSFYAKASSNFTLNKVGFENYSGYTSMSFSTEWKKYSRTFTATKDSTSNPFVMYNGWVAGISLYIKDFKLEKGSKATPYCPNSADSLYTTLGYNDNIEYDCSGYNNNGTKSGNITWSSDTPRYSSSYIPTTASSYISTTLATSGYSNSYTISYWAKIDDMTKKMVWGFSDGNRINVYPADTVLYWNTGDGGSTPFQNNGTSVSYTSYNGTWHHYAITGDGTTATLYIDGIKAGIAKTYKAITGTKLFISGWDTTTNYKWTGGNISDFRIYATALSADDVLQLYNAPICIDNHSNISAYDFIEGENASFSKNGITTHKEFVDYESSGLTESTKMKIYKDHIVSNDFTEK